MSSPKLLLCSLSVSICKMMEKEFDGLWAPAIRFGLGRAFGGQEGPPLRDAERVCRRRGAPAGKAESPGSDLASAGSDCLAIKGHNKHSSS